MCVAWQYMHLECKLKPQPASKPRAAANPDPKGQHGQEFRMVYQREKGFTSEPVGH